MIYNAESRIGNFKNSFGNEIVFYAQQSEYDVLLSDGSTIKARHAWMKSDKQKDHSSAVRWMGDGGSVVTTPNNFSDVYIIKNVYSSRTTNTVMKVLVNTPMGGFIVDLYVDNFVNDIIGKIEIDKQGKLLSSVSLYSTSSGCSWAESSEVTTSYDNKKLGIRDLVIGGKYKNTTGNTFIYIGRHNKELLFVTDDYRGNYIKTVQSYAKISDKQIFTINGVDTEIPVDTRGYSRYNVGFIYDGIFEFGISRYSSSITLYLGGSNNSKLESFRTSVGCRYLKRTKTVPTIQFVSEVLTEAEASSLFELVTDVVVNDIVIRQESSNIDIITIENSKVQLATVNEQ